MEEANQRKQSTGNSEAETEPVHTLEQETGTDSEGSQVSMEQERDEWKQKAEEHQEQYLRARADLENFRRRVRKEQTEAAKYAVSPLAESLLPVVDNLERALMAGPQDGDSFYQGVDMVYRQLLQVLKESGVEAIDVVGKPFDPHEHNAVMKVASEEHDSGIVLEELQRGYRLKERVLRPAMVKVSE
ncbi:nucleotide exchange factor GrpE [Mechercharimyces sp. CAU 1602]|uniref:nucleotide exchange factor GrpE n=1 Tax=Mechercharimyces sp. CAU 1602 TaxID=2973933 RepID=UPI0021618F26|nr:nucleotide exchange factor GrpE [Mechercharimyces sp. CAU 1602]MCS1350447.1 nucleotide exchange factor GrpE [Mechercharimyces sp. CAU 1602]